MPAAAPECANPLFLKWLEELRDNAREKGLRTADVYNKACRSVASCPIKYDRPRELVKLQGIGPKTVQILETRLKAHCTENNIPLPTSPAKGAASKGSSRAGTAAPAASDDDDDDDAPPPPKKKRVSTKPYIPQKGSGAYGILIGLLSTVTDFETTIQVFQTKGEIIQVAQPYSTSSYDHSERGGFATAWGGMKTLVSRGYVIVQGSPQKFCLTEDGYDVAAQLRNMHPDFVNEPRIEPLARNSDVPTARAAAPAAPATSSSGSSGSGSRRTSLPSTASKFLFTYVDSKGERVKNLLSARMLLDPEEYIALRQVEFHESQRSHAIVSHLRMVDEDATVGPDGQATLFAWIMEDGAPPQCSGLDNAGAPPPRTTPPVSATPSRSASTARSASTSSSSLRPTAFLEPEPPVAGPSRSRPKAPVTGPPRPRAPRLSSQLPLLNQPNEPPKAPSGFNPSQHTITFPHGSYEVVLILDTREVESRSNRDKIAESLEAKGVRVETRALRMGDMCWVARRTDGLGGEEDECVLDYVIERKRLDDLCSSIRDGRYAEQCFRLQQSGIGNVFYVVEDWQLAERMEFHGKQIMTAKSQIQVVNGFFLKETHKLSDTIEFLAMLTRMIIRSHHDLKVIPSRYLSRTSYSALQRDLRAEHPSSPFLTTFEAYQALNDKSAARTLREGLGRMLLCVRGMSAERVAAVLEHWETPRALYEAMREREARGVVVDGRKKRVAALFFADEVVGEGRRKIGDAQSKELWKALWGKTDGAAGVGDEAM